ncbi:MAG: TIGR00341 family protein [Sulfurovaceae bacterium]|nr:TIGR00341 family protein [Sulfurovaceae bacterium]MDD5548878.1 TIGR00341 family protein [Sulfurovaceae bacterium]
MTNLQKHRFWLDAKKILKDRFNLTDDKADDDLIDERIRADINMKGANLWILIFAILVASVGLNVNSTAVIIGAMLISPLMGPSIGMGYGAGINDFGLIRKSFKNLSIAVFIAILTSTVYFLITPLHTVQSELLLRTSPTAWDVLIGFFGGLAGIIGVTRQEKSNVIPGVAIATALMPPLCTAGFALATAHWNYFFGAFYLFTINFVFIALSAFLVIRIFNVAEKKYINPEVAKKTKRYIILVVIATILPSSYLAYKLVKEEVFKSKANNFINEYLHFKNTDVARVKINPKTEEIKVFLIGDSVPQSDLDDISVRLKDAGLDKAKLKVYQNEEQDELNVSLLKADIISDLYKNTRVELKNKKTQIEQLNEKIVLLSSAQEYYKKDYIDIPNELQTLFPKVNNVILSQNYDITAKDKNLSENRFILNVSSKKYLTKDERKKIETWLKMRTKSDNVKLIIDK